MSDHKEFDDYVKGLFGNDPKVPAELDWDGMDFDLPVPIQPNKKPGRKFLWLLLLPLFLGTCSVGYLFLNTESDSLTVEVKESIQNQLQLQPQNQNQPQLQPQPQNQPQNQPQLQTQTQTQTQLQLQLQTQTQAQRQQQRQSDSSIHSMRNDFMNNSNSKITSTAIEQNRSEATSPFVEDEILDQSSEENIQAQTIVSEELLKVNSTVPPITINEQNTMARAIDSLPPGLNELENDTLIRSTLSDTIIVAQATGETSPVNVGLFIRVPQAKIASIYIGYGFNTFSAQEQDSTFLLGNYLKTAPGRSFYVGFIKNLSPRFKANVRLKYDEYRSVFEHTKNFDPIYDFQNSTVTDRREVTYHNNYTKTVGLYLGAQGNFYVFSKSFISLGFGLSPTYALSTTGKTFLGREVETLAHNDQFSSFSLPVELNAGFHYRLTGFIDAGINFHANRVIYNQLYINEGVFARKQYLISVNLGYRFRGKYKNLSTK